MGLETLCLKIATEAHEGQFRKNSNLPFIVHPNAVAAMFKNERMRCIALLHDVVEDSSISEQDLLNRGVPKDIVDVVVVLTRQKNENYLDYMQRVIRNDDARWIKKADLHHNISDLDEGSLKDKYRLAYALIIKCEQLLEAIRSGY